MSNASEGKSGSQYWESRPPPPPRTAEVVGVKCANADCHSTKGISFEKPLCYECWKLFDGWELLECEKCHWFDESVRSYFDRSVGRFSDEDLCWDCGNGRKVPVYHHAPVERRVRYLYFLKLDGGEFYVGQTNDLELRLQEHRDGRTKTTAGKHPRLVWFAEYVGDGVLLNEDEDRFTRLARENPRAIRRMVAEFRRPLKLLDLDA